MLQQNFIEAEQALNRALFDYENNGTRYEPADREALINLILQVEELGKKLSIYMSQLPFLDSHPIGVPVLETAPDSVAKIFEDLEKTKFISPEGPLKSHMAYHQLKELFQNTSLTILEAHHLLHPHKSTN